MADSSAIRAGRAFVELLADDSKLISGLRGASAKLKSFGNEVAEIGRGAFMAGAGLVAPIVGAAKLFASTGDELAKLSSKTGIAVETLSALSYAAGQSDVDMGELGVGLRKMQQTLGDAANGSKSAQDALGKLGLTVGDLMSMKPDQQFRLIADRMASIPDPALRTAAAMDIFGRNGAALIPLLERGADGIAQMEARAKELGLTMSTEAVRSAESFNDTLKELWAVLKRAAVEVGAAVAPALKDFANWVRSAVQDVRAWIGHNREVIVTILKIGAGLALLGAAAMVVGKIIAVFGGVVKAVQLTTVVVRGLGVAFTFLAAHPVVAVLAAVASVAVAVGIALSSARGRAAELHEKMSNLRDEGDRLRSVELLRMKRLEQLAAKEQLNNAEMTEAEKLIGQLEGRYGKLGLELDATGKRLQGVADAQKRLNEEMKRQAVEQLSKEMEEIGANIGELQREASQLQRLGGQDIFDKIEGAARSPKRGSAAARRIDEIRNQVLGLMKRLDELGMRRSTLLYGEGGEGALTGQEEGQMLAGTVAAGAANAEELAKMDAEWTAKLRRLKLEAIEDEHARQIALINDTYDNDVEKAKAAGAAQGLIDKINAARKQELDNAEAERNRKNDAERAANKLRDDQEEARRKEAIAQANKSHAETVEELELQAKFKGIELDRQMLALQRRRAIDAAKAAGENVDLVEREYDLREQILEAGAAAEKVREKAIEVSGTFSSEALSGLGVSSRLAERTAAAAEETAENTKKIADAADEGELVFV